MYEPRPRKVTIMISHCGLLLYCCLMGGVLPYMYVGQKVGWHRV